jgi:hypothetical protein
MRGVIVQIGEPKSIVLLNNGKITAIPTPANCHVGMVVTVKVRNLIKIVLISLAAALLFTAGIIIGAQFFGGKAEQPPASMPWYGGYERYRNYRQQERQHGRQHDRPGRQINRQQE